MALIKLDIAAIKTARQSAVREKLNPRGRALAIVITPPEETIGSIFKTRMKGRAMKINARTFLKAREITPAKGRINAPRTGTKTVANKSVSLLI